MPRDDVVFPTRTPVALIHRLREGRPDDWQTFYAIYGPMIYRIARRCHLRENDAEEVTAIVISSLTPVLLKGFKVNHARGRFRGYIAQATRHAAVQYIDGMKATRVVGLDAHPALADDTPPDEELARWERRERMRVALDLLEKKCGLRSRNFRAFRLYVIDDEPAKAVAARYGIKPQRLYEIKRELLSQLERILHKLAEELGEV